VQSAEDDIFVRVISPLAENDLAFGLRRQRPPIDGAKGKAACRTCQIARDANHRDRSASAGRHHRDQQLWRRTHGLSDASPRRRVPEPPAPIRAAPTTESAERREKPVPKTELRPPSAA